MFPKANIKNPEEIVGLIDQAHLSSFNHRIFIYLLGKYWGLKMSRYLKVKRTIMPTDGQDHSSYLLICKDTLHPVRKSKCAKECKACQD